MKFKIVSDSSADLIALPKSASATENEIGFAAVPLKISTSEREFVDTPDLDTAEMLSYLASFKGRSRSSCPNASEWEEAFEEADNIFCITITSALSGSYNSALAAKEEHLSSHPQKRIHVIDTLSVGPEAVLIIEELCRLISSGMDFDSIVEKIEEYKKSTSLIFALKSLHNLACNGRVNAFAAKIAGVLGIRIVGKASEKGTLELTDKTRGERRMLADIVKNMKKSGYSGGKVRIHHCEAPETAEKLKEMIVSEFTGAIVEIYTTRALCSFYAERGGLLIGY